MELLHSGGDIIVQNGAYSFSVKEQFANKLIWILDELDISWIGDIQYSTIEIRESNHQEVEAKILDVDYELIFPRLVQVGATLSPIVHELKAQWIHHQDNKTKKIRIREEKNITEGTERVMVEIKKKIESIPGIKHCIEIGVETNDFDAVLGVFGGLGFESIELPSKKVRKTHYFDSENGLIVYDFDDYISIDGKGPFPTLLEVESNTHERVVFGLSQIGIDESKCVDLSPGELVERYFGK